MHEQPIKKANSDINIFSQKTSSVQEEPQVYGNLNVGQKPVQKQVDENREIIKKSKKAFTGTGFTLDIGQFFKFKKRSNIEGGGTIGTIFYEISGSGISWLILIYSVMNASFFPIWTLAMKTNKFIVLVWRFFLQSLIMIPFVLHEKRTISEHDAHKYTLSHILNLHHIKPLFIYSIVNVMWYTVILTAGQYTYLSHAFYLGSLANFFLSLARHRQQHVHQFQVGGQLLIILGVIFVFYDTLTFRQSEVQPQDYKTINHYYLSRTKHERFAADLASLAMSVIVFWFENMNLKLRHVVPPYLSMLIINGINTVNLTLVAYFFNGATFDAAKDWGLFSIFEDNQFALFLYTVIILTVGLVVSFALVAKLFPNFVIPTIVYFFQPAIVTALLNFSNIQGLPGSFSFIGYTMITPGMSMVIFGQWLFIRSKLRQQFNSKTKQIQLQQFLVQKQNKLSSIEEQQYKQDAILNEQNNMYDSMRQKKQSQ